MSLETTLIDITSRLRQGRFPNEQAISQGIVLRILQELGWDTWDTAVVWPEYQTGQGRADFALCHPPSKPAAFVEVKQPGNAENGVRQALEYAFHTGVPFIVLTDGKTWSFYLPAEQGSYEDRRVYKLDLFERPAEEAAETLKRYLEHDRVESGTALETARKEYRSRNRRSQARAAIPEAWRELVEKGDELLVDILASAVESKAGVRPEDDDVAEFLAGLGKPITMPVPPAMRSGRDVEQQSGKPSITQAPPAGIENPIQIPSAASRSVPVQPVGESRRNKVVVGSEPGMPPVPVQPVGESRRNGTLILRGKAYSYSNAKEAIVIVLSELAKADPSFLERCSQHPDAQGRKRRYIARTALELYPDRPDLHECRAELPCGWLVATNLNNVLKKSIIRLAAEVAGLTFGKDVIVDF